MTAAAESVPVLSVRDLEKAFGGVRALRGVSFDLHRGEVLGLLGDNGAGKSTLVKCIAGTHVPDAGEILVDGEPAAIHHPDQARALGIETVFQELALIDSLDVPSNLFLGREEVRRGVAARLCGWLDRRRMERQTAEILDRLQIRIASLKAPVAALSGGQRQSIAVGRAVAWGRHIVLLDEPAAALGVEQAAHVLELVERLHEHGVAVVLISHNMQHVLDVCSRVVVLRHGTKVADQPTDGLSGQDLVGLITGATAELRGV
jgi:simple sugar transport system ATP-binding protein